MRQIRFRQRNKNNGQWHYWGMVNGEWINPKWQDNYEHPSVSNQFTGLFSKDGKEIWEGDIVQTFNLRDNIIGKIQWNEDRLTWMIHPPDWHKDTSEHLFYCRSHIEVIGKIYENPEFLMDSKSNHSRE